jgi:uncharacterized membrane protein (UPF0127 family)
MWFDGCSSVHTIGMRARMDVVFLDVGMRVVGLERRVGRNRLRLACQPAVSVLELGISQRSRVSIGDRLSVTK